MAQTADITTAVPSASGDSSSSEDEGPAPMQYGQHTEASTAAMQEQQRMIADAEARRRAASMVVPTDPTKIRSMLRTMREPITLFGEREVDRRERLRKLLGQLNAERREELTSHLMEIQVDDKVQAVERFYTEGTQSLLQLRLDLVQFSAARALVRLENARMAVDGENSGAEDECDQVVSEIKHLANYSSQISGKRPAQGAAISPDSSTLITASWSGGVTIWNMEDMKEIHSFVAHEERCTDAAWHPEALCPDLETGEVRSEGLSYATASADGVAKCWNMAGTCVQTLAGHTNRLARLAFHPSGRALATCSFDGTWRLWDAERGECLVEQEGHSRAVYCIGFHPDGSLCASGGYDAIARVWDCRTGRNVMTFQGHVHGVLSIDFSTNGYHVASGSEDNTVRIWDLRKRGGLYTIPAHTKLVSQVKFDPVSGAYLLTTSYDRTAKVWSCKDWMLNATLAGHEDKIMCADISKDGTNNIITTSYDKTIKLWQPDMPADPEDM